MSAVEMRTPLGVEMWETTIEGAVWVRVVDQRGNERQVAVGPSKGARLRVKTVDRENTQDSILDQGSDPFTNGTLRRIDNLPQGSTVADDLAAHAYTDDVLHAVLAMPVAKFRGAVDGMNERGVRALKTYALANDATVTQLEYVQQVIDARYKVEKVMPSTAEIIDADLRGDS